MLSATAQETSLGKQCKAKAAEPEAITVVDTNEDAHEGELGMLEDGFKAGGKSCAEASNPEKAVAEEAADEKAASTTEEEAAVEEAAKEAEKPASAKIFPEEVPTHGERAASVSLGTCQYQPRLCQRHPIS